MATLQELLRERQLRSWRPSGNVEHDLAAFERFCFDVVSIAHPSKGRIPFALRAAQKRVVRKMMSERKIMALKSRQIGYSTVVAVYCVWLCMFRPDTEIIFLSKGEREARHLLRIARYAYRYLPVWLTERTAKVTDKNIQKLTFSNDSVIESMPSKSDPARGRTAYLVVVDEWAFLENPEEAWSSIEPVADIGGRIMGLSTANGAGNFFHHMVVGARTGNNGFAFIFEGWDAVEERDQSWYDAKVAENISQPWVVHQEYPRNPDEAFIRSGNAVFDTDHLLTMKLFPARRGVLWVRSPKNVEFREGANGDLWLWEYPKINGGQYVIGADVSEGLVHGDYSSAHVLKVPDGEMVAHYHGKLDPDVFGEYLCELGWWYNTALLGIERNNHGLTTVKAAQRAGYKRLYKTRRVTGSHDALQDAYGFATSFVTKPLIIDGLVRFIRDHNVVDEYTLEEMKTYVRDDKGKMHGSPHDDRVMSYAIARQMLEYVHLPEFMEKKQAPKNSIAWFEKQMDRQGGDKRERKPIGYHNVRTRVRS